MECPPKTLEADQTLLRVDQDEGKGKWGWLNALWDSLRRSKRVCSPPTLFNNIIEWILAYKITQWFNLEQTSIWPTSAMPTISWLSTVATERWKACLKLFIAMPPQSVCAITPRRPRWCQHSSLLSSVRVILLDGEPLEDADKFKHLGSMFNVEPGEMWSTQLVMPAQLTRGWMLTHVQISKYITQLLVFIRLCHIGCTVNSLCSVTDRHCSKKPLFVKMLFIFPTVNGLLLLATDAQTLRLTAPFQSKTMFLVPTKNILKDYELNFSLLPLERFGYFGLCLFQCNWRHFPL